MRIAVTYDDTEVYQHFGDTSYFNEVILLCDTTDTDHDQEAALLTCISGAAFHLRAYYII